MQGHKSCVDAEKCYALPATQFTLKEGRKRHQCHYSTMFGDLMVGVFTDTVKSELNEKGGRLYVSYSLDFNAGLVSKNEIIINVKEKEVQ